MDFWVSSDGADWKRISDSPWNATLAKEIKYDFKALPVTGGKHGPPPSIFTFGGDRETFKFTDPENYLQVDNDAGAVSPSDPASARFFEEGAPDAIHPAGQRQH